MLQGLCIVLGHNDTSLFLIIEMFVWALISEAKWSKKLIRVVIWPYVTGFVEAIISLPLNVVVGDAVAVEVIKLVRIVLTIMVWTVIAKRKWYQKAIEYIESTSLIKKLLISSVIFFGVGVAAFGYKLQILSEYRKAAGAFSILVMLELCLITAVVIWLVVEGQQKRYYAEHNQSLCCIFENPASEIMYQAAMEGKTTKEDAENHGHGVKNIRQAVERLGGEMEYRYENGKIRLEIIL